jgi:peroxiredoxin Q/BCP
MGVVRTTFIINPENKIAAIWENVKVRENKTIKGEKIQILHSDVVKETLIKLQNNQ